MSLPSVVVVDPGIDDMLALMTIAGLGHQPEAIVATAGNTDVDTAYRNASCIAHALRLDCPVARGAKAAMAGPYPDPGDPFHGPDGLGGTAHRFPSGQGEHPDALSLIGGSVLATGPLTVIAEALRAGRTISRLTWMGGSVNVGGNITPAAEYNAWMDPEAADDVLTSGVDLAVVPLDVTQQVPMTVEDIADLAGRGTIGALAAEACRYIHDRDGVIFPHDATAVIAQTSPELFTWEDYTVRCETAGHHTRGMTVADRRRKASAGEVKVAVAVDVQAVKKRLRQALNQLR